MGKFKQHIGQKIRDRRKLKGFKTQELLATAIGADRTRVSRWESGENLPDPVYKEALARALEVDESFFEEPGEAEIGETIATGVQILDRLDRLENKIAPPPNALEAKVRQFGDDLYDKLMDMDFRTADRVRRALKLKPRMSAEKIPKLESGKKKTTSESRRSNK